MENAMSESQPTRKLIPLNLTARSDVVKGNPVSARPESGVDNAHPGFEFDTRILNRVFFPGLVFDFQYGLGARLVDVRPELSKRGLGGLEPKHIEGIKPGVFLWYIIVRGHEGKNHEVHDVFQLDGYEVLRLVSALDKGDIIVIVGQPPENLAPTAVQQVALMIAGLLLGAKEWVEDSKVITNNGQLEVAILSGTRAEYLDKDGVIDPAAIEPGQLTQSLCSPWQWDFA